MKYSLGGKQFIEFKTDVEGLEEFAPVKPASLLHLNGLRVCMKTIEMPAQEKKESLTTLVNKEK